MVEIVAGLTLKQLQPTVWDLDSPYYIPQLRAVMVSYADFHRRPSLRKKAMDQGIHYYLGVPDGVKVYLDNGAFYFLTHGGETPRHEYEEFVNCARPDWYPIPQDYIPTPQMSEIEQRHCLERTMEANLAYQRDGYVPVVHISRLLEEYTVAVTQSARLATKPAIALGGIVPNLLRAPKAMRHNEILHSLIHARQVFSGKRIHVFGIGGTATLHIAALLNIDSVDSSGWRNRAARGIVQLPGSGDRSVANLGSWRGREPSPEEWQKLAKCKCPACQRYGLHGLTADKSYGFFNRATHNLWTLLEEAQWVQEQVIKGTYRESYRSHLDNSIYRPLIDHIVEAHMSE